MLDNCRLTENNLIMGFAPAGKKDGEREVSMLKQLGEWADEIHLNGDIRTLIKTIDDE